MAKEKKKNQIANEQKWNRDTQSWWIIEAFLYSFPASIFIDLTIDNGFFFLAGRKRGSMLFYYFSCDYFLFMPRGHQFSSFIIGKKKKEDGERNSIAKKGPSVSVCVGPVSAHWEKKGGNGGWAHSIDSTRHLSIELIWYDATTLSLFLSSFNTHALSLFFSFSGPASGSGTLSDKHDQQGKDRETLWPEKKREREMELDWIFMSSARVYCTSLRFFQIIIFYFFFPKRNRLVRIEIENARWKMAEYKESTCIELHFVFEFSRAISNDLRQLFTTRSSVIVTRLKIVD